MLCIIKRQDPHGAMLDLVRENRFFSIDEEVGLVAVVRMDHNMDYSSSSQPLP